MVHALRPSLQGCRQNRGQPSRLLSADISRCSPVVVTRRRFRTIDSRAPFDHVQVNLQNAPLAEDEFGHRYKCDLRTLAKQRSARSEKQVFYKLLGDGGSPARATSFQIVIGSDLDLMPIESVVLVKARVFSCDHSMLELGRDLAEGNESVTFMIRRVVNPRLQAALDVHRGCRRVNPTGSDKSQSSERPNKHHANGKPPNKYSEKVFTKRGLVAGVKFFSHSSEIIAWDETR